LAATGDLLPHRRVKSTAAAHGWAAVFGEATPILTAADVAFANLEGPIAPDHHRGVHGEVFDAPADLAPALAAAGLDVVSLANNHLFDQGPGGLVETRSRVRAAGVATAGAGATCAEAAEPAIVEVHGVKIAFLAATDLTNLDLNAGADAPCLFVAGPVCEADCGPDRDAVQFSHDLPRLLDAVKAARARADFVVLSFHWQIEWITEPLPEYPPLAAALTDAGVDVLLGHHPHVLQPVVERTTADGRRVVIAYSLGNFVSNMGEKVEPTDPAKGRVRDAIVLQVPLVVYPDGRREVGAPVVVPLWTENALAPDGTDRITVRTLSSLAQEAPALAAARAAEIARIVGESVERP
ncbi:MAG: CapA family protein, partial [Myxococcota bacterium]